MVYKYFVLARALARLRSTDRREREHGCSGNGMRQEERWTRNRDPSLLLLRLQMRALYWGAQTESLRVTIPLKRCWYSGEVINAQTIERYPEGSLGTLLLTTLSQNW